MLTCRDLVELVTDYLADALPDHVRQEVVAHLRGCSDCLRYLAQLQLTVRLLGRLPEPSLPADVCADLAAAFRRHRDRSPDGASDG